MAKYNNPIIAIDNSGTTVTVPDGYDQAMTLVKQMSVVRRQPIDSEYVPLNVGITTGPKFDAYRLYILGLLRAAVGRDRAEDFTDLLCTTGMVPNPTSSPNELNIPDSNAVILQHVYACVQALASKVYSATPIFSNVHVNSESSTTFPYFLRGEEGVAVKRAYHESYCANATRIYDELSAFDLNALQSSRHHLPMFGTTYTGGRVQVRGMKEVEWQGDKIVKAVIKPMRCHNYLGEEVDMDMDIPGTKVFHTMRGRAISSASATTNQLAQEILTPIRNAMYTKGVWHASDWGVELRQRRQIAMASGWSGFTLRTYDFARMDAHMNKRMFEAYIRGVKDAGWSEAYTNLARWIHFSPIMCPCDVKTAPYSARFTKVYGCERGILVPFDAGQRSGQWDTDVSNKIYGTAVYFVCGLWAGLLRKGVFDQRAIGASAVAMYKNLVDTYWDTFFEGKPTYGDSMFIVGNCGDDNEVAFEDATHAEAYAEACSKLSPTFDITEEPFCNFLGNRHSDDGSSMAFEGKCLTNNLSPEQPITSPRRKDFWPLGMIARDEHYKTNPFYTDVLRPVLNTATAKFYGSTWFELVAHAPILKAMPAPKNAAEFNFLWDQSIINYKASKDDVSEDFILASGAYFSVSADESRQLYELFRR